MQTVHLFKILDFNNTQKKTKSLQNVEFSCIPDFFFLKRLAVSALVV